MLFSTGVVAVSKAIVLLTNTEGSSVAVLSIVTYSTVRLTGVGWGRKGLDAILPDACDTESAVVGEGVAV